MFSGLSLTVEQAADENTAASNYGAVGSHSRGIVFWGMALTASAAAGTHWGLLAACLLLIVPVFGWKSVSYGLALLAAVAAYLLGPDSLVLIVPLILVRTVFVGAGFRGAFALTAGLLLSHHFEIFPVLERLTMHPGSTGFIVLPVIAVTIAFGPVIGWRAVLALLASAICLLAVLAIGSGRWLDPVIFASGLFRIIVILGIVGVAAYFLNWSQEGTPSWSSVVAAAMVGATVAALLPIKPVSSIVFDEAHGKWATVQAPFGPNDFGRGVNYTYSSLYKYAERTVGRAAFLPNEEAPLPAVDAIFVLKMPVLPLSTTFGDRLEAWVRAGGRLMVVADHTDLYDTAQNLNEFLSPRFGLRVNSDAVFDARGMPTVPATEPFSFLFGRIDAHGRPVPWQTGTSLAGMPITTVRLASFGPSYSEPGDYSRPNRFGPFLPRTTHRFADHVAIAAVAVEQGAIAIILDSTPWSNFSIFIREHRHIFKGIVRALEKPAALQAWGWGSLFLALAAIAAAARPSSLTFGAGGLALGFTLGAAATIGAASFLPMMDGRDFGLRVVLGKSARLEFLGQLVGPGERNFARIISAMGKFDLDPQASAPGEEVPELTQARKWLLIQPEGRQLPSAQNILAHLRDGKDLSVVFSPDQAADVGVRTWLSSLGLFARKSVGLAAAEDSKLGLLNRKAGMLLRDVRPVSGAVPTSLLKERNSDTLMQSYTVRPTTFPRRSGLLNIAFAADQFSDDSVGEVWDGVQPSSLGRLRERQLASLINGEEFPAPFPDDLFAPAASQSKGALLPAYLVLENGRTILSGRFATDVAKEKSAPSDDPVGYLGELRDRAIAFVVARCPKTGVRTSCKSRLLGPDAIEWMAAWAENDAGQIVAIELLHERRFSGLGATVNVVFGQ